MKKISILGCGWLGLPLGQKLLELGYKVHGSTSTKSKCPKISELGIQAAHIQLDPLWQGQDTSFFDCDVLVITLPFKRSFENPLTYLEQMQSLPLKQCAHILFTSSTSIYPMNGGICTEESPIDSSKRAEALKATEDYLQSQKPCTVVRFSGLYGPERQIGKFLAGKSELNNAQSPVNLIHQKDCLEILCQIIKQNIWVETFNACSDEHPTRKELYTQAALDQNLETPKFNDQSTGQNKVICNQKLKKALNYTFFVPRP